MFIILYSSTGRVKEWTEYKKTEIERKLGLTLYELKYITFSPDIPPTLNRDLPVEGKNNEQENKKKWVLITESLQQNTVTKKVLSQVKSWKMTLVEHVILGIQPK